MARTFIRRQNVSGVYSGLPVSTLEWSLLDAANGNSIRITGGELLQFRSAGGAGSVTIVSTMDPQGRTGNLVIDLEDDSSIVYSLCIQPIGFQQADGTVFINSTGPVEFAFWTTPR